MIQDSPRWLKMMQCLLQSPQWSWLMINSFETCTLMRSCQKKAIWRPKSEKNHHLVSLVSWYLGIFRDFLQKIQHRIGIGLTRNFWNFPWRRHVWWQDILLYRGELARCADLLAFQLGKELLSCMNGVKAVMGLWILWHLIVWYNHLA